MKAQTPSTHSPKHTPRKYTVHYNQYIAQQVKLPSKVRRNVYICQSDDKRKKCYIPVREVLFGDMANDDCADGVGKDDAEIEHCREGMAVDNFFVVGEEEPGYA